MIQLYQEKFNDDFVDKHMDICKGASCFVGMHPDQATEAIVDTAFKLNKPFAIVPCCVYPSLFPNRKLSTGQGVKRYNSFLQYLREKDTRIMQASLPFLGRNKVLYWQPKLHREDKRETKRKRQSKQELISSKYSCSEIIKKRKTHPS